MVRNLVFDFGGVLVDWNPHYLYDPYFGDKGRSDFFLENICTMEWNTELDGGKPFDVGIAERTALFPEWEKEIRLFKTGWKKMMKDEIPGMRDLISRYRNEGYHIYGITNWSWETLSQIWDNYPIFSLMEGTIISGKEHLLKPHREIFDLLCERYSLSASECVFIDDNPTNIAGARNAGFEGIVFKGADNLEKELTKLLKR